MLRHLDRKTRWALLGVVILIAACGIAAVGASGQVFRLVCPASVTNYATVPFPAPPLTGDTRVKVGQEVSVGGYVEDLPLEDEATLSGDRSAVTTRTVVAPTEERCGRTVEGYQFLVLTAVHPGEVTVTPPAPRRPGSPTQPPRTLVVVAAS